MSFLWIALGLILRVNVGFSHAGPGTRMIRRCMPGAIRHFHPAKFFERDTTPVCERAWRLKSGLAIAAVLKTQHAKLSFLIPAQSVWAE